MALLLEIGYQVRPDQTAEGFLSGRDRHASSLVTCPFTLCTLALEAQVGQEGIGKTDQMQVCNCDPIRAVLELPQPQQLLGVFQPLLNCPAPVIRLDKPGSRCLGVVGHQAEDLASGPFAREDDMQDAEFADLQPPGITIAVADLPLGRAQHERRGATASKQIAAIAAGLELPSRLEETAVALSVEAKCKRCSRQPFTTVWQR